MTPVACTFCGKFDHLEGACLLRSDPGVPTGDNGPRWTVDERGYATWRDDRGNSADVSVWAMTATDDDCEPRAYRDLVRAVRDAAQVPALQATAQRWEQARELAERIKARGETLPPRSPEKALLDLLTEAPDGE